MATFLLFNNCYYYEYRKYRERHFLLLLSLFLISDFKYCAVFTTGKLQRLKSEMKMATAPFVDFLLIFLFISYKLFILQVLAAPGGFVLRGYKNIKNIFEYFFFFNHVHWYLNLSKNERKQPSLTPHSVFDIGFFFQNHLNDLKIFFNHN